jgi:hypothetical protein
MLTAMQANGMRLLKLINDLLDLVRVESGRLEVKREPVQMEHFIAGLAAALRAAADDKRVRLSHRVAPEVGTVLVDRDKLEKILLNLMFNAVKFTPSGGLIEVTARRESERLVCTVRDTGVGISAKNLPFVFDRFWQADTSSRRKYQGMGIGLALGEGNSRSCRGERPPWKARKGKGQRRSTVQLPYLNARRGVRAQDALQNRRLPGGPRLQRGRPGYRAYGSTRNRIGLLSQLTTDAAPGRPRARSGRLAVGSLPGGPSCFPVDDRVCRTLFKPVETPSGSTLAAAARGPMDGTGHVAFSQIPASARIPKVIEAEDGQQALDKAAQFSCLTSSCSTMMRPEKDGARSVPGVAPASLHGAHSPVVLLTARG